MNYIVRLTKTVNVGEQTQQTLVSQRDDCMSTKCTLFWTFKCPGKSEISKEVISGKEYETLTLVSYFTKGHYPLLYYYWPKDMGDAFQIKYITQTVMIFLMFRYMT